MKVYGLKILGSIEDIDDCIESIWDKVYTTHERAVDTRRIILEAVAEQMAVMVAAANRLNEWRAANPYPVAPRDYNMPMPSAMRKANQEFQAYHQAHAAHRRVEIEVRESLVKAEEALLSLKTRELISSKEFSNFRIRSGTTIEVFELELED